MFALAPSIPDRPLSPLSTSKVGAFQCNWTSCGHGRLTDSTKMYASSAARARLATVARRGFSTSRAQLGSPYHYAEGPRTNIPFNPLTKHFFWRYWAFMGL
jgi:cytochrome c oxidase subunit 7c